MREKKKLLGTRAIGKSKLNYQTMTNSVCALRSLWLVRLGGMNRILCKNRITHRHTDCLPQSLTADGIPHRMHRVRLCTTRCHHHHHWIYIESMTRRIRFHWWILYDLSFSCWLLVGLELLMCLSFRLFLLFIVYFVSSPINKEATTTTTNNNNKCDTVKPNLNW